MGWAPRPGRPPGVPRGGAVARGCGGWGVGGGGGGWWGAPGAGQQQGSVGTQAGVGVHAREGVALGARHGRNRTEGPRLLPRLTTVPNTHSRPTSAALGCERNSCTMLLFRRRPAARATARLDPPRPTGRLSAAPTLATAGRPAHRQPALRADAAKPNCRVDAFCSCRVTAGGRGVIVV